MGLLVCQHILLFHILHCWWYSVIYKPLPQKLAQDKKYKEIGAYGNQCPFLCYFLYYYLVMESWSIHSILWVLARSRKLVYYLWIIEADPYLYGSFWFLVLCYPSPITSWLVHEACSCSSSCIFEIIQQFYEPSAFAQDAVHPFEAILQGPMGHFFVTLIYPMNPLLISALGYLTSIYALMAHDARQLDFNDHVKHHHYRNCNYGLYWGLCDYIFGTRYSK